MRLLYFASIRERLGLCEERLTPPAAVTTVAALLDWQAGRSDRHSAVFRDRARLKVAVNQDYARLDTALGPDDEVAIFPPVTGG